MQLNNDFKIKIINGSFLTLIIIIIILTAPSNALFALENNVLSNAETVPQENKNTNKKSFFLTTISPQNIILDLQKKLLIKVTYENRGNIETRPDVKIDIKKYEGGKIKSVFISYPANERSVEPGEKREININLDAEGLNEGKYIANITVMLGDEERSRDEFAFIVGEQKNIITSYKNYTIDWPLIIIIALIVGTIKLIVSGKPRTRKNK